MSAMAPAVVTHREQKFSSFVLDLNRETYKFGFHYAGFTYMYTPIQFQFALGCCASNIRPNFLHRIPMIRLYFKSFLLLGPPNLSNFIPTTFPDINNLSFTLLKTNNENLTQFPLPFWSPALTNLALLSFISKIRLYLKYSFHLHPNKQLIFICLSSTQKAHLFIMMISTTFDRFLTNNSSLKISIQLLFLASSLDYFLTPYLLHSN